MLFAVQEIEPHAAYFDQVPIVQFGQAADFLSGLSGEAPTETHISAVFVGPDTVWKLKKAIRMPFLDFSTLDARAHFLLAQALFARARYAEAASEIGIGLSLRPDWPVSSCSGRASLPILLPMPSCFRTRQEAFWTSGTTVTGS